MKRILLFIGLAVVLAIAGFYLLWQNDQDLKAERPVYCAIPPETPFFAEIKNIESFPSGHPAIQKLNESGLLGNLLAGWARVDSAAGISLKSLPFTIAFFSEKSVSPSFLLIAKANSHELKNSTENLIASLYPPGKYRAEKQRFEGRKIVSLISSRNIFEFSYCFTNGLLLASPQKSLVEKGIRQIETGGLSSDERFIRVNKTATRQNNASVYINHCYAAMWKGKQSGEENAPEKLFDTGNFASWTELDLSIEPDVFRMNGISVANDSLNQFLPVFAGQQAVEFEADKTLPQGTPLFLSFTFSNKEKFFSNLHLWQRLSENTPGREKQIRQKQEQSGSDLIALLENLAGQEITMAYPSIQENPAGKETAMLVSVKGQSQAREAFEGWLKGYAEKENTNLKSLIFSYEIDRETRFSYYRFPLPDFPEIWLGGPFSQVKPGFAGFCDNFLVFASSQQVLEKFFRSQVLEANLANDIGYQKFKQNTDPKANINFYVSLNKGFPVFAGQFPDKTSQLLNEKKQNLQNFTCFNWQVMNTGNLFFNSMVLGYSDKVEDTTTQSAWQNNIGGNIRQKPEIVVNPEDPDNREIIVQDDKNYLHLITKDGRIRWSISLPEEISGGIHQVDFKRNGKLQYVFNTKTHLYMLDHDGNNTPPFPVSFRSPATNEVSIFDYDNNRKYRYFVAGEDKKIYAFDESGNVLQGWNFGKTDREVVTPIRHFRISGKDYIVFTDGLKIYIQDRRGETRVKIPPAFEFSSNPLFLDTNGTPKIVAAGQEGNVYYLFFNGKVSQKKMPPRKGNFFFEPADLDGNGITDFVFSEGNQLQVIDENGKILFTQTFNTAIPFRPEIFTLPAKQKKIGILNPAENRVYLYNPDGTLYDGFPLPGNSLFNIGKLAKSSGWQNLIVGGQGGVVCNYSLN